MDRALPVLQQRGLSALWRSEDGRAGIGDNTDPSILADRFVTGAVPASSDKVYLFVSPNEPDFSQAPAYTALLNQGC